MKVAAAINAAMREQRAVDRLRLFDPRALTLTIHGRRYDVSLRGVA